jgi:hypothetical protein
VILTNTSSGSRCKSVQSSGSRSSGVACATAATSGWLCCRPLAGWGRFDGLRSHCDVSTLCRTKNLAGFSGLLIDQRSASAIGLLAPLALREHCAVFTDSALGCLVCVLRLPRDQGGFSGLEAALRHRVVPTIAWAAQPGRYRLRGQALPSAGGCRGAPQSSEGPDATSAGRADLEPRRAGR